MSRSHYYYLFSFSPIKPVFFNYRMELMLTTGWVHRQMKMVTQMMCPVIRTGLVNTGGLQLQIWCGFTIGLWEHP